MQETINRTAPARVALETTLLAHGVPRESAAGLASDLDGDVRSEGGTPAVVGVLEGRPIVGMTGEELARFLDAREIVKVNLANLGVALHRRQTAATTVSATMALASGAGVRVFATGGLGGIHRGEGALDVSSDLIALSRFPMAVVSSGVKSILDVESTREALETLGVPVAGFRTDRFPAFYQRESGAGVDARFDDADDLAAYLRSELARGRGCGGVLVANPVPEADEIPRAEFDRWLKRAEKQASGASGRDATPATLAALHELSGGATLRANLALVRSNARLAAGLARRMDPRV